MVPASIGVEQPGQGLGIDVGAGAFHGYWPIGAFRWMKFCASHWHYVTRQTAKGTRAKWITSSANRPRWNR